MSHEPPSSPHPSDPPPPDAAPVSTGDAAAQGSVVHTRSTEEVARETAAGLMDQIEHLTMSDDPAAWSLASAKASELAHVCSVTRREFERRATRDRLAPGLANVDLVAFTSRFFGVPMKGGVA